MMNQETFSDEKSFSHHTRDGKSDSSQRFLLSDDSYQLLRLAQQNINDETDVTPTLRKMINELINEKSVKALTSELISKLR